MAPGPLSDLCALELAQYISGPYCAKLLADLGAEVIKVEPPQGDAARRAGPFPGDVPHPEKSALFLYLNANKLGVTLDVTTQEGRRLFLELLRQADFLVENNPPSWMEAHGLDYKTLRQHNPRLIMVSITGFGQTGPYRDYRSSDLISFHMGGAGYDTPQHGVESLDLPPLRAGGHQADFMAGIAGAAGAMAALFDRDLTGEGQQVDLSAQEALVSFMGRITLHQYTYEQETPSRRRATDRLINHVPCKNGYVNILIYEPHWWHNLVQAMGNPEWAQDPLFQSADFRSGAWDAVAPLIEAWAQQYTKEELFAMLQEHHVPCLPGNTFADLPASGHLRARGFLTEVTHPVAGTYVYPGAPYRLSATPWAIRRPAPLLGEHNEEVFCGRLGYSKEDLVRLRGWGVI